MTIRDNFDQFQITAHILAIAQLQKLAEEGAQILKADTEVHAYRLLCFADPEALALRVAEIEFQTNLTVDLIEPLGGLDELWKEDPLVRYAIALDVWREKFKQHHFDGLVVNQNAALEEIAQRASAWVNPPAIAA